MAEEWSVKQAIGLVKMARYLLTTADNRGLTHGEKHFYIQTALALLTKAQLDLGDSDQSSTFTNELSTINASDIPF